MTPLETARLARLIGREIARGMSEADAEMRQAEARALSASDPLTVPAQRLLDAIASWAAKAASTPRAKGGPEDVLLQRWIDYAQALRESNGV